MYEIPKSTLQGAWVKFHTEIFPIRLRGDVRKRLSCINLKKSNSRGRGGGGGWMEVHPADECVVAF